MVKKCWLHNRDCNEKCAAFLLLECSEGTPIHGVPLLQHTDSEMRTYCAIISALWRIGEGLIRISNK